MKKIILAFGMILGAFFPLQAIAGDVPPSYGAYTAQKNPDSKVYFAVEHCANKSDKIVTIRMAYSFYSIDEAIHEAKAEALNARGGDCGAWSELEQFTLPITHSWICISPDIDKGYAGRGYKFYFNSGIGQTLADATYLYNSSKNGKEYNYDNDDYPPNCININNDSKHIGLMNRHLTKPTVELDTSYDEVVGYNAAKGGVITNVETLGSAVDYICAFADNADGDLAYTIFEYERSDYHISRESCSLKLENGKLVFRVKPVPEFRNKYFGVLARRSIMGAPIDSTIRKYSNFVPLGNMCAANHELINGECVPTTPHIRIVSNNADGSKTIEITDMLLGAHYSCIIMDGSGTIFDPSGCKVPDPEADENGHMRTKQFIVGAGLNGKYLVVHMTKGGGYIKDSNEVFLTTPR